MTEKHTHQQQGVEEKSSHAESKKEQKSGKFVLLVDKMMDVDGETHHLGDVLELEEHDVKRLKDSNSIAPEGSVEARIAQGELRGDIVEHVSSESDVRQKLAALKAQLEEIEENKGELRDRGHEFDDKSEEQLEGERTMKAGSDKAAYQNAKAKGDRP